MVDNDKKHLDGFDGDADELLDEVVGSGQRNGNEIFVLSQELEKWEKINRFNVCLVKRKLLKEIWLQ